MKVILNKDLQTLGEEGDVKDVARGYARNYLFPRGIALPYNPKTIKAIEARRSEIEARKEQKRLDARSIKEKLDELEISITMPAGANGKLYGAVTNQTISDELSKAGFQIERKRIEIPGSGIKNTGKYKAVVKLYENQSAEISLAIIGQEVKAETQPQKPSSRKSRREEVRHEGKDAETQKETEPGDSVKSETQKTEKKTKQESKTGAGQIPYFYFMGK